MPGIDRQRVVGKSENELDELTCSICRDIFDDPVVTQCCRQTYCKDCINEWLKTNNICPNDRKRLTMDQLAPVPRLVINLLNILTVKCENYGNGCQTVLTIEEMAKHMLSCDYYSCNSCKTSKILLSEKHKEIDSLRNQLKTITPNRSDKDLIISARKNPSFEVVASIGLTGEQKIYLVKQINDALNKNNSFGEMAHSIKENFSNHYLLKELIWTIIIGLEYNALIVGKIRLCIKYNNGLKVIIIGYKQN